MKKIIVIGSPGAGKSTLSRRLSDITGIPLYHLDMMYWNPDRTTVTKEVLLSRMRDAMSGEEWIIDGNYSSTLTYRLAECDTVIMLDYPTEVCLDGIEHRRGKPRTDMPWIEDEPDEEFVAFVKRFADDERPKIMARLDALTEKRVVILKSRDEADLFLNGMIHTRRQ